MAYKVLVVDDEDSIRRSLKDILKEEGYTVTTSATLKEAEKVLKNEYFNVIVLDVWMPDGDGVDFIKVIKEVSPDSVVVMITGHGNIEIAVKAIKSGAYDFIEKPFSIDRLLLTIKHAVKESLSRRKERQEEDINLIGESQKIKEIKELIPLIAKSKAPVLITGESGTGKELVARLIHHHSGREGEFVDINCASLPSDLIEAELYGYEKGAFTGASRRKRGKFELADRGTLFLDEIGEMDPKAQAKLLRVIETGKFTRLGGTQTIEVDVRIISATNKDLMKEIKEGRFREDLFYRISVLNIDIPPLRERGNDVLLIAEYFVKKFCTEYKKKEFELPDKIKRYLLEYDWRGNVRELKNFIERLVILCDTEINMGESIIPGKQKKLRDIEGLFSIDNIKEARRRFEKAFIEEKLEEYNYDIRIVAEKLGTDLSNLYRKIKAYGIDIKARQG